MKRSSLRQKLTERVRKLTNWIGDIQRTLSRADSMLKDEEDKEEMFTLSTKIAKKAIEVMTVLKPGLSLTEILSPGSMLDSSKVPEVVDVATTEDQQRMNEVIKRLRKENEDLKIERVGLKIRVDKLQREKNMLSEHIIYKSADFDASKSPLPNRIKRRISSMYRTIKSKKNTLGSSRRVTDGVSSSPNKAKNQFSSARFLGDGLKELDSSDSIPNDIEGDAVNLEDRKLGIQVEECLGVKFVVRSTQYIFPFSSEESESFMAFKSKDSYLGLQEIAGMSLVDGGKEIYSAQPEKSKKEQIIDQNSKIFQIQNFFLNSA